MRVLPETNKKRIIYAVILLLSIGGIVYFNFVYKQSQPGVKLSEEEIRQTALPAVQPGQGEDKASEEPKGEAKQPQVATPKKSVRRTVSDILPFGDSINASILNDDKFKALQPSPKLNVTTDEVGRDNIFTRP